MNEHQELTEQDWKGIARQHLQSSGARRLDRLARDGPAAAGMDLDDVLDTAMLVPLGFEPFESTINAIQDAGSRALTEVVLLGLGEVEQMAYLSPEAIERLMVLIGGEVSGWAMFCFGVGVELGLHNLMGAEAFMLVETASELYSVSVGHLAKSLAKGELRTRAQAVAHRGAMQTEIEALGYAEMELGMEMCEALDRKSDEFLQALKRLG